MKMIDYIKSAFKDILDIEKKTLSPKKEEISDEEAEKRAYGDLPF